MNIVSILAVLGVALLLSRIAAIPLVIAPATALCGVSIFLYVAAIFGVLGHAEVLIRAVGVTSLFLLGISAALSLANNLGVSRLRYGLLFLPIPLSIALMPRGIELVYWDEYSTWGPSLRIIWQTKSIWNANAPFEQRDILPGQQIIQSFFLANGNLDEWAIISLQLGLTLVVLATVVQLMVRSFLARLFAMSLCMLMPFAFGFFYRTIYVDLYLSVVFAAALACAYRAQSNPRFRLLFWMLLVNLALLKQSGTVLALCALIVILLLQLANWINLNQPTKSISSLVGTFAVGLVCALLPITTWSMYLNASSIQNNADLAFFDVFTNPDLSSRWSLTIQTFLKRLVQPIYPSSYVAQRFPQITPQLSLAGLVLVLTVTIIAISLVISKRERRFVYMLSFGMILSFVGYLMFLLISYVWRFSYYEGVALASFERYHGTFLLPWTMFIFLLVVSLLEVKPQVSRIFLNQEFRLLVTGLGVVALLLAVATIRLSIGTQQNQPADALRRELSVLATDLQSISDPAEKIYFVDQGSDGFSYLIFRWIFSPSRVQSGCWSIGAQATSGDLWSCNVDLKDVLNGYQYLVVYQTDFRLASAASNLIKNPHSLQDSTIFRITLTKDSRMILEPLLVGTSA